MHRIDTPGSSGGLFTEGNPYGSPPTGGTVLGSDWANDVQENLAGAIEGAGLVLEKGNWTQLADAIRGLAREAYYRGREMIGQTRLGSTTLDLFGLAAPTALGTLSASSNANGPYVEATTTSPSSTPEDVGWRWSWNETQRRWESDLEVSVTGVGVTNTRLWFGLFSGDPSALQSPTSISCAGFRFDYSIDATANGGDGCWKSVTSDGAAATVKSTGVAFTALSRTVLRVRRDPNASATWLFSIDGVQVTSHAGTGETVPAASTSIGPAFLQRHLSDTSSKSFRLGWFRLRSK